MPTNTATDTFFSSALESTFLSQRANFYEEPYPDEDTRQTWLSNLKTAVLENREDLVVAVQKDFGHRSRDEILMAEILPSVEEIHYIQKNLKKWMKPSRRKTSPLIWPAKANVEFQPLGVVGVIVPWNYPIYLALSPLMIALAAGNRVMVKMSESTPETYRRLREILKKVFPREVVSVFGGGVEEAEAFSYLPFDHLLFTGSTAIGQKVMAAASQNLTPVTLELGGKSPVILTEGFSLEKSVERILFAKCLNSGQTCVAPDYLLCPAAQVDSLLETFQIRFKAMFPNFRNSSDYGAIINKRQFDRLKAYLIEARRENCHIVCLSDTSGAIREESQQIAPHLVVNPPKELRMMKEEVFGPILPVIPYKNFDEAIDFINERPRPLALYLFDTDPHRIEKVKARTRSGSMVINECMIQVVQADLPFGGIGASGIGQYHGPEGFLTFSKARPILQKGRWNSFRLIYPPYSEKLLNWLFKLFFR